MSRTLNNRLRRRQNRRQAVFLISGCAGVTLLVLLVFTFAPTKTPQRGAVVEVKGEVATAGGMAAGGTLEADDGSVPPLSLAVGGDVCFGLGTADYMAASGPAYPWAEIAALLSACDFSVANLEGPLCRSGTPHPDQPTNHIKGDASCAPPMAAAGLDALCLANDHIMDYGSAGLEETLNILSGQDMEGFGAGPSRQVAEQPLVMEADNGARLALVAFCDVAPPSYAAGENSPGISAAASERVAGAVSRAAEEAPYVMAYFHWGELSSPYITARQRELARAAVAAGADLVVGCHSHMVQGMEIWQGVPVIYSLGNLVFSARSSEEWSGILASCRFADGRLAELEITPLRLDGARPAALCGAEAEAALQQIVGRSPGADLHITPGEGRARLVW